ncbi:hypothetical protein GO013_08220 [Pseudodesulfovibrio sp. JC047]|uniref:hypothetical protein n=1 Tax=Pseudodesulfovibrio sp. JC047 TaxID=2683199 RepID=UPI0013D26FC7|nr:hypothetical protein [Pseudodesulfovibrio sp. JC047]NDV19402.1 hypothetical protein [Pseudodesulfovibrio sp. JC047]
MSLVVIFISMVFQFAAGIMALRLIIDTGRSLAWIFLAAGIFAMAFRRVHALYEVYTGGVVGFDWRWNIIVSPCVPLRTKGPP